MTEKLALWKIRPKVKRLLKAVWYSKSSILDTGTVEHFIEKRIISVSFKLHNLHITNMSN